MTETGNGASPNETLSNTPSEGVGVGPGASRGRRPGAPARKTSRVTYVAILAAVLLVGGGAAYEVVTSKSPGNPCAAFTPEELGANPTPGNVTGDTTPNYPAATVSNGPISTVPAGQTIKVVAAENFWGSLVSQMGGNLTSVLSIVSDPNADPHEYEANTSDAAAVAEANFVIVNGDGYDEWASQLIASSNTGGQEILNVSVLDGVNVNGGIVTGNPHQWYNPLYVNHTLLAMYSDLVALQPTSKTIFQQNFANLNTSSGGSAQGVSIDELYNRADQIREKFAGTVVASTESIFVYLANYTGLDLISPQPFMEAIAEGNDPPAQSVSLFECQLESGHVRVLVYNVQTVTPITTTLEALAAQNNVTVTEVSETIQPTGTSFQAWMYGEYDYLENALNAPVLGK
jgi:zinc/manganese transport system substrate-binding protein